MDTNKLTETIIGAAMDVHRALGPGLLESAYEECLCHELRLRDLHIQRQLAMPVSYKGIELDCGYRLDLVVSDLVVVELKAVESLLPIHEAQLLTYLKLGGWLVLGGGNTSLVLAPCAEHFKRLGSACRKCRAIYAQPH